MVESERRWAQRHTSKLPVRLSSMLVRQPDSGQEDVLLIAGYTRDISETGLALLLPTGSVSAESINSEEEKMHVVLELPSGYVNLEARFVRCERLDQETDLIGASILGMDESDQATFNEYLTQLTLGTASKAE